MTYCYISRKFLPKLLASLVVFVLFSFIPEKEKMEGLLFENESVVITSRIEQCILPKNGTENVNVLLSIRNKTNQKISVGFQQERYYNEQCTTCGKDEYYFRIALDANAVKEATCEQSGEYGVTVFHHMPNGKAKSRLTDLQLKNVTVTEIK